MNDHGVASVILKAQELRAKFEAGSGRPGAMQMFYEGIDLLDAHLKDSRYMRHRDRICEERRAYARALIQALANVAEEDSYLAGVCAVLLKREIDDIAAHESGTVRQLEALRDKAKNNNRTNLLFEALRIHIDDEQEERRAG